MVCNHDTGKLFLHVVLIETIKLQDFFGSVILFDYVQVK